MRETTSFGAIVPPITRDESGSGDARRPTWVGRYLDLLGLEAPPRRNSAGLATIARRHAEAVPFHNLDLQVGEPGPVRVEAALDAVLGGRGGTCFELNLALGTLLDALGYHVRLVAGRVWQADRVGIPHGHLALLVRPVGTPTWITDVGFGDRWMVAPFPDGDERVGVAGVGVGAGGEVDISVEGVRWYRLSRTPLVPADFDAAKWYFATGPDTRLNRSLVCSIATATGRVTLADRRLITLDGTERAERRLAADSEILSVYRDLFGLTLDRLPRPRRRDADGHDWFGQPSTAAHHSQAAGI
ncbi:MAG: arylamine N-acetyltransferase family protein [Desertimonas sp.]